MKAIPFGNSGKIIFVQSFSPPLEDEKFNTLKENILKKQIQNIFILGDSIDFGSFYSLSSSINLQKVSEEQLDQLSLNELVQLIENYSNILIKSNSLFIADESKVHILLNVIFKIFLYKFKKISIEQLTEYFKKLFPQLALDNHEIYDFLSIKDKIYPPLNHDKTKMSENIPTVNNSNSEIKEEESTTLPEQLSKNTTSINPSEKSEKRKNDNSRKIEAKWSIQLKLMAVISFLLTITISTIIYLASYFFKEDSKIRIMENSIQLVNIIGSKVKNDFNNTVERVKQLVSNLNNSSNSSEKEYLINLFFEKKSDFFYIGILDIIDGTLKNELEIFNQNLIDEGEFTKTDIETILTKFSNKIILSGNGNSILENVSPYLGIPSIGIFLPGPNNNDQIKQVLVIIQNSSKLTDTFQQSGITETFMVNEDGVILFHPDEKLVLSRKSLINVPIVSTMLKSVVNNGQTSYKTSDGKNHLGSYKKIGFASSGIISTILEDKAFEAVYLIQKRNIYIMIIGLSLALIVIFFFARTLSNPILKLLEATLEIAKGNFSINIKPTTKDEVGLLTKYFSKMAIGLEEREKVKDALGRFVNKDIAEMVLKKELHLGGELKNCAIFFSDIRSFTAISEKLAPDEVVGFLNEYMTEMVKCVNKTHGIVDKFIGDAIMATWGAIKPSETVAEDGVNAALLMRDALIEFNKNRGGDKKPIIRIGCGLNYGPVIAGQIGSEERLEYTVIGDAVNLASRVEALNKPMGTDILITQDLYDMVKSIFKVEKMQSIKVKGKEKPQTIYAVLGRFDNPNSPKSLDEMRKMVGIEWDPSKAKDAEEKEVKYEIIE